MFNIITVFRTVDEIIQCLCSMKINPDFSVVIILDWSIRIILKSVQSPTNCGGQGRCLNIWDKILTVLQQGDNIRPISFSIWKSGDGILDQGEDTDCWRTILDQHDVVLGSDSRVQVLDVSNNRSIVLTLPLPRRPRRGIPPGL